MDIKENKILAGSADTHWYYRSKSKAMLRLIDNKNIDNVLDVGAGSGYFSIKLLTETNAKSSICVDINYKNDHHKKIQDKDMYFTNKVDMIDVDLVLMMDVIEHVDDDVALLKEYISRVPVGTLFFISVPAFQFMWSGHDVFLGHKRRYTLKSLESSVRKSGLTIDKSCYYFMSVFPLAFITRFVSSRARNTEFCANSQLKEHSTLVNNILKLLSRFELLFFKSNRLGGLSVFCLARKE